MTRCFRTMLVLAALVLFAFSPALADQHMGDKGKSKAAKDMKEKVLPGQAASGEGEKTGHEDMSYGEDRGGKMEQDAMDKGKQKMMEEGDEAHKGMDKMMEKADDKGMMKKPAKGK